MLPPIAAGAIALLVVGPLLRPGFTLAYDMVFVPHPHFSPALLGLSPAYPRAVPTQLIVTAMSTLVPAQVLQKIILLLAIGGGALGASRLPYGPGIRARGGPAIAGAIAAGVLYAWTPMAYERFLLGQWALLLGVAILPWAVGAALRFRTGVRGSAWRLILWLAALGAASPYLGAIGGATTLAVALCPPRDATPTHGTSDATGAPTGREVGWVLLGALLVNLPWLTPTLLHPAGPGRPALSLALFRARSDSPLGTIGSVLSFGGVWRTDLAPPGRATIAWVPVFLIIAFVTVVGWRRMSGAWTRGARIGLLAASGIGLLLALAPDVPGLRSAAVWAIRTLPGGGFLRDSQKFAIPFVLAAAVGFGSGVASILEGLERTSRGVRALALTLVVLPIALAPTFALGAARRLGTTGYPASWSAVERIAARDPIPGGILTLPWHAYLPFAWNGETPVHQPAPLYFARPVLAASGLEFGDVTLPGEDPWAGRATAAVRAPGPLEPSLAPLGVRYVLVYKIGEWRSMVPKVAGLTRVFDAPDLALYRGAPPGPIPSFPGPPAVPVVAGDVLAALTILAAAVMTILRSRGRWSVEPGGSVRSEPADRSR